MSMGMFDNRSLVTTIFLAAMATVTSSVYGDLTTAQKALFEANSVTITEDGGDLKFEHTGVPSHQTDNFPTHYNPNSISTKNHVLYVPKTPQVQASTTCLPGGTIGMAISGVVFYNAYTREGYDAVVGDCKEQFDMCDGHPDESGTYHYHQLPNCVASGTNDEILGVALDGFLIYGPKDSNGNTLTSADLDECGGRTVGGIYRYHIQSQLPYVMGCFKGSLSTRQIDANANCITDNTHACASDASVVTMTTVWVAIGTLILRYVLPDF